MLVPYIHVMKNTIALLGASAVILGALGAHALDGVLTESALASYKTGANYHLMHSIALLATLGLNNTKRTQWLFTLGILFFSGSIYLLTLDELMGVSLGFLGPITPIGGLFFIAGWLSLLSNQVSNVTNVDKS